MYADMTIVGKSILLREGYPKVTGMLKFAPDYSAVGSLWMKILRSPYPHAIIRSIDVSEAEALSGVRAVLTHKDVPQKEIGRGGLDRISRILDDRVRFIGDEIAAVAAETAKVAEEALDFIQVEYEKLPAVFDIEEALKPDAPDVRGVGSNKITTPPDPGFFMSHQEWGDLKQGFEQADAIVEHELRHQSEYGGLFPPACIAEWADDKLTIIISHQGPHGIRDEICESLDIPEYKVRIIAPLVAGPMGTLNSTHRFWYLAALLSKKAGKPVVYKMTQEEFGVYKSRQSDIVRVKMGGTKDGIVTALDYEQLHDNGGYGSKTTTYQNIHEIFTRSNVRVDVAGVNTNKLSTGSVKGTGNIPQSIAINQTVDKLAEKLGVDPLTIWKKNHHKAGDLARLFTSGQTLSSEAYDELIDKGAEAIGWVKKWQGWGKPYEVAGSYKKGVGMAIACGFSGIAGMPASASIEVNRDGKVQILIGSMDLGTGCKTTHAQVCAEVLGFKVEDVYVIRDIDTDTVPYMPTTASNTALVVGGLAIQVAAADTKRQLLEMALTAPWSPDSLKEGIEKPEDLDIKESMIYVKADPSRRSTVKEIVSPMQAPQVIGKAGKHDISPSAAIAYVTLSVFADVEVDTDTGQVKVLKLVHGVDSGRIVNPEVCEMQVHGGTLMSLGCALMEEIAFEPANGKVLNPALKDYWVPGALDAPPMEVIFSDNIDPVGPLGAKSLGDTPNICPHAAIASAIYNAIGVRISQLPITPDKVLKALGKTE